MTTDVPGLITIALILLLGLTGWLAAGYLREQRALAAETRRLNEWEQEVIGVTLPEWDGETYEWWPETGLSRYLDAFAEPAAVPAPVIPAIPAIPAIPVSRISGPMRALAPTDDVNAFISALRSRADTFIALMDEPLEVHG